MDESHGTHLTHLTTHKKTKVRKVVWRLLFFELLTLRPLFQQFDNSMEDGFWFAYSLKFHDYFGKIEEDDCFHLGILDYFFQEIHLSFAMLDNLEVILVITHWPILIPLSLLLSRHGCPLRDVSSDDLQHHFLDFHHYLFESRLTLLHTHHLPQLCTILTRHGHLQSA